jgi:gliding motility-associated-like protein
VDPEYRILFTFNRNTIVCRLNRTFQIIHITNSTQIGTFTHMRIILLFLIIITSITSISQTSLSGVVNSYFPVSNLNIVTATATVPSVIGLSIGDTLLIIQMKGANIDISDSPTYGTVDNYYGAGNAEFVEICDLIGTDIVFTHLLEKSYQSGGSIQLISFPDYADISIDGPVTAQEWNGSSGGVVLMRAQNSIILNDNIDVSHQGFRGGTHINSPFGCTFFLSLSGYEYEASLGHGGMKGEGIAGYTTNNGGRGALGNGGGGGNDHNSGGGGGSNLGAGGIGGINDEPNTSLCQGDYPGDGGIAMVTGSSSSRMYLGGGGGAGHSNGPYDNKAGDGGGMVILIANDIIGNGNTISANGQAGIQGSGDGGSGGGAGGSIMLESNSVSGTIDLEANGANGGAGNGWWVDSLGIAISTNPDRCFGPGGGGGGGLIWFKSGSTPGGANVSYTGGNNGIVINTTNTGCDGSTLGAMPGNGGASQFNGGLIMGNKINKACVFNPQLDVGNDTTICDSESITLTAGLVGGYEWSSGETTQSITTSGSGTYWVKVDLGGEFICDTIIVSQAGLTVDIGDDQAICGSDLAILDAGAGGVSYTWSNSETTQVIQVSLGGTYSVIVDDGVCVNSDEVVIIKCVEDLFIPNTITPNGDGENDTWIINGLQDFPENTVVIMNRNGAEVYSSVDYQSDWNGGILPASTYFYFLDLKDGISTFKGTITVVKQL